MKYKVKPDSEISVDNVTYSAGTEVELNAKEHTAHERFVEPVEKEEKAPDYAMTPDPWIKDAETEVN